MGLRQTGKDTRKHFELTMKTQLGNIFEKQEVLK